MSRATLYDDVTRILLSTVDEAGNWKPCWHNALTMPENGVTERQYRGINVPMLWAQAQLAGYASNRWATYKQWQAAGCQVRKGEKSSLVLFFDSRVKELDDGSKEVRRIAKAFNVFNAQQCDGDHAKSPTVLLSLNKGERCKYADMLVARSGAVIREGRQPCYIPAVDEIRMPEFEAFFDGESYYSTMFHELAHWTGAKHRLDRDLKPRFDKASYAMEELVAELAACFVATECGLEPVARPDHAAYLKSWRDVMQADNAAIVTAASAAAKAADYIFQTDEKEEELAA